jgi:hypothetical protein
MQNLKARPSAALIAGVTVIGGIVRRVVLMVLARVAGREAREGVPREGLEIVRALGVHPARGLKGKGRVRGVLHAGADQADQADGIGTGIREGHVRRRRRWSRCRR